MATRVDLNIKEVRMALEKQISSLTRQIKDPNTNPLFLEILNKDLATHTNAKNTLTEVK